MEDEDAVDDSLRIDREQRIEHHHDRPDQRSLAYESEQALGFPHRGREEQDRGGDRERHQRAPQA